MLVVTPALFQLWQIKNNCSERVCPSHWLLTCSNSIGQTFQSPVKSVKETLSDLNCGGEKWSRIESKEEEEEEDGAEKRWANISDEIHETLVKTYVTMLQYQLQLTICKFSLI